MFTYRKREDGQFSAEDTRESCQLTCPAALPPKSVCPKTAQCARINKSQHTQVDAHKKICSGEVANEEPWDVHLSTASMV